MLNLVVLNVTGKLEKVNKINKKNKLVNQFRWQKDTRRSRGFGVPVSVHQSSFIRMQLYKIPVIVCSMTFSMKYKSRSVIHLKGGPIHAVAYPGILFGGGGGGVQQIQLRTEERENEDLGAVAP